MKSKIFCLLFIPAVFIFGFNSQIFAQKKIKPEITKKISYLKARDRQLEAAIRGWNGKNSGAEIHYFYNTVDLNGDGKKDALVFISGDYFCGTGGCEFLVFKGTAKGYQLVTEMSVSRPPIIVAEQKTNGWSDLIMRVSGGGIEPFYADLKFDGKSYPKNPTVVSPIRKQISGGEYLSGIENYNEGFLLK